MTTMNISLPDELKEFIDRQVAEGGYGSSSEYIRELIRRARTQAARRRLEAQLLKGINSGPAQDFTPEDWKDLRRHARERWEQRHGRKTV